MNPTSDQTRRATGPEPDPDRTGRRGRWPAWLFLAVFSLYLFTGAGQFQTIDAAQELGVAVSMRHGNGVRSDFPVGAGGGTTVGRDGHTYAGHDIGSSLLYLPFTLIADTVERFPTPPGQGASTESLRPNDRLYFAASFLPPLLGALIVVVFARTLTELGFDAVTAVWSALALAVTSTIWVYAHVSFDSTATALAVAAATLSAVRFHRRGLTRDALAVGLSLGAGVLVRIDTAIMVPFLAAPVLIGCFRRWRSTGRVPVAPLAGVVGPVAAAGVIDLAYNWYRFGSIFDNGHTDDGFLAFNPRIGEGFLGQVASPGKGMLIYSPLLIAALFRWRWFLRRHTVIAASIAGATLATLLAHSAIVGWAGDQAWGARFTVVVVPLVAIPLARVVQEIRRGRIGVPGRLAVAGLALAGVAIQLSGVLVDFFAVVTERRLRGEDTSASLTHAAYLDGFVVLWRALSESQPHVDLTPAWEEALDVARLDLWWVRAAQDAGWNLFTVGIPIALVAIAVFAVLRLRAGLTAPAPGRTSP